MSKMRNPIPADAKLVFKGKLFEVWQWEQKMFDGSTITFERLKRPNTVQVLATEGDSIILLNEEQPDTNRYLTLPGGRADEGEDPLVACKRELLEETGYAADSWDLFNEDNPVGKMEWTIYTYVARDCRYVQEPHLDGGERIEIRKVGFEELLRLTDSLHIGQLKYVFLKAQYIPLEREKLRKLLFG